MNKTTESTAVISEDRKFRYVLKRIFNNELPIVAFVGLNPSTADVIEDDPTIRKCINYCEQWGYGGFYMVNLFAIRSPDKTIIKKQADPIGQENDAFLKDVFDKVNMIICSWGNDGAYLGRSEKILEMIQKPMCIKINASGEPAHPLYLSTSLKPIEYNTQTKHFAQSLGQLKGVFTKQIKDLGKSKGLIVIEHRMDFKPQGWTRYCIAFSFELGGLIYGLKRIEEDKNKIRLPEVEIEFEEIFEVSPWWAMYRHLYESISSDSRFIEDVKTNIALKRANDFITMIIEKFGANDRL